MNARYQQAHEANVKLEYPSVYADGHYTPPVMPPVATANGLTRFIINYLTWKGHRATRISSAGRVIGKGRDARYIPGQTRKGTADISATIHGRSVMLEVKVGKDRPSDDQLAEQARERAAGGIYEFVHTPEEFFAVYDSLR